MADRAESESALWASDVTKDGGSCIPGSPFEKPKPAINIIPTLEMDGKSDHLKAHKQIVVTSRIRSRGPDPGTGADRGHNAWGEKQAIKQEGTA